MIDFEAFIPGEWQSDGLVIIEPAASEKPFKSDRAFLRPQRGPAWRNVLVAVSLMGATTTSMLQPLVAGPSSGSLVLRRFQDALEVGVASDDEVSPERWKQVLGYLRSRPNLPDDQDHSDPEPLV